MSSLQDGERERSPCIHYKDKTATLYTSCGEVLIRALPQGLLIEGVLHNQLQSTYTVTEANLVLSLLKDSLLVGDEMATLIHEYRSKAKMILRLADFRETCTCQGHDLMNDMLRWLTLDCKSLLISIQNNLSHTQNTQEKVTAFIMKTVQLANML